MLLAAVHTCFKNIHCRVGLRWFSGKHACPHVIEFMSSNPSECFVPTLELVGWAYKGFLKINRIL